MANRQFEMNRLYSSNSNDPKSRATPESHPYRQDQRNNTAGKSSQTKNQGVFGGTISKLLQAGGNLFSKSRENPAKDNDTSLNIEKNKLIHNYSKKVVRTSCNSPARFQNQKASNFHSKTSSSQNYSTVQAAVGSNFNTTGRQHTNESNFTRGQKQAAFFSVTSQMKGEDEDDDVSLPTNRNNVPAPQIMYSPYQISNLDKTQPQLVHAPPGSDSSRTDNFLKQQQRQQQSLQNTRQFQKSPAGPPLNTAQVQQQTPADSLTARLFVHFNEQNNGRIVGDSLQSNNIGQDISGINLTPGLESQQDSFNNNIYNTDALIKGLPVSPKGGSMMRSPMQDMKKSMDLQMTPCCEPTFSMGLENNTIMTASQDPIQPYVENPQIMSGTLMAEQDQKNCGLNRNETIDKPATKKQLNRALTNLHDLSPFAQNNLIQQQIRDRSEKKKSVHDSDKKVPSELLIEASQNITTEQEETKLGLENINDTIDIGAKSQVNSSEVKAPKVPSPNVKDLKPKIQFTQSQLEKLEKEKVFQLRSDVELAGPALTGDRFQHQNTSFETLNTVDHLFMTGTVDGTVTLSQRSSNILPGQNSQVQVSNFGSFHKRDDSIVVDNELQKINQNLSSFTLMQFKNLRENIQTKGFSQQQNVMLQQYNQNSYSQKKKDTSARDSFCSGGVDLPSELTITIDNNLTSMMPQSVHRNMKSMQSKEPILMSDKRAGEVILENAQGMARSLNRKIGVKSGSDSEQDGMATVVGFNCSAPRTILSDAGVATCVVDKGSTGQVFLTMTSKESNDDTAKDGAPLFCQLLTPEILQEFFFNDQLMPKQQIKLISCGFDHCLAVTYNSGHVYSWGYGASGCLGHGTYESSHYPRQVTAGGLQQKKIVYAECGGYHSGAVTEDGYLYMWGRADVGQLGIPQAFLKTDSHGKVATVPMHVSWFQQQKDRVCQIALGEAHTLTLTEKGQVHAFGWSELGQLGVKNPNKTPQQIHKVEGIHEPCSLIVAGAISSMALGRSGNLYAWGGNQNGQLGIGNNSSETESNGLQSQEINQPELVLKNVVSLVCGDSNCVVKTQNGDKQTCFAWGRAYQIEEIRGDRLQQTIEDIAIFEPMIISGQVKTNHLFSIQEQDEQFNELKSNIQNLPLPSILEPILSQGNEEDNNNTQNFNQFQFQSSKSRLDNTAGVCLLDDTTDKNETVKQRDLKLLADTPVAQEGSVSRRQGLDITGGQESSKQSSGQQSLLKDLEVAFQHDFKKLDSLEPFKHEEIKNLTNSVQHSTLELSEAKQSEQVGLNKTSAFCVESNSRLYEESEEFLRNLNAKHKVWQQRSQVKEKTILSYEAQKQSEDNDSVSALDVADEAQVILDPKGLPQEKKGKGKNIDPLLTEPLQSNSSQKIQFNPLANNESMHTVPLERDRKTDSKAKNTSLTTKGEVETIGEVSLKRPRTTKTLKSQKAPIDKKSRQSSKLASINTSPKPSTQKSLAKESPFGNTEITQKSESFKGRHSSGSQRRRRLKKGGEPEQPTCLITLGQDNAKLSLPQPFNQYKRKSILSNVTTKSASNKSKKKQTQTVSVNIVPKKVSSPVKAIPQVEIEVEKVKVLSIDEASLAATPQMPAKKEIISQSEQKQQELSRLEMDPAKLQEQFETMKKQHLFNLGFEQQKPEDKSNNSKGRRSRQSRADRLQKSSLLKSRTSPDRQQPKTYSIKLSQSSSSSPQKWQ